MVEERRAVPIVIGPARKLSKQGVEVHRGWRPRGLVLRFRAPTECWLGSAETEPHDFASVHRIDPPRIGQTFNQVQASTCSRVEGEVLNPGHGRARVFHLDLQYIVSSIDRHRASGMGMEGHVGDQFGDEQAGIVQPVLPAKNREDLGEKPSGQPGVAPAARKVERYRLTTCCPVLNRQARTCPFPASCRAEGHGSAFVDTGDHARSAPPARSRSS